MNALRIVAGVVGIALMAVSGSALAQSKGQRLDALESGMNRMERMLENNQAIQTDMLSRIQALQAENQVLRNSIDELKFKSDQSGDRQRQLYIDLDSRLQALESGSSVGYSAGATTSTSSGAAVAMTDGEAYQAAFELLKQGRYDEAQKNFIAFQDTYADSDLRGNAQYWLAETYYVTKDYEKGLELFNVVISDYPASRKIPDAWLKVGYCNYELKRWSDAKMALSTAIARYGESTAAKLAEQRLAQIQKEGN